MPNQPFRCFMYSFENCNYPLPYDLDWFLFTSEFLLLNVHGGQKGDRRVSETSAKQAPTRKTKAAVDRCQNNRMLRQCPSSDYPTTQLLCYAEQSQCP